MQKKLFKKYSMQWMYLKNLQLIWTIIALCLVVPLLAQEERQPEQKQMSDDFWTKTFWGSKDNYFDFKMTLIQKDGKVQGWYHYLNGLDTFYLEGFLENGQLWMEERFADSDEVNGQFVGRLGEDSFIGTWQMIQNRMGIRTVFSTIENRTAKPLWFSFETKTADCHGKWTVWASDNLILGIFVDKEKQIFTLKQTNVAQAEDGTKRYTLAVINPMFNTQRYVEIIPERKQLLIHGEQVVIPSKAWKFRKDVDSQQQADFHQLHRYFILTSLDKNISDMVIFRDTSCSKAYRKRFLPELRGVSNKVSYFTPTFSGLGIDAGLYMVSALKYTDRCLQVMVFNRHTKSGKNLDLRQEMKDPVAWDAELQLFLKDRLLSIQEDKRMDLAWQELRIEDFNHLVLTDAGIAIVKDHDPVIGMLIIGIDPAIQDRHLKDKSIIKKILKR